MAASPADLRAAFRAGQDVAAWLLGILRNRARRTWRAREKTAALESHPAAGGSARDPAADAAARELTAEVDAVVPQLAETYRPVLRLPLRHGLTAAEIALALDRPAGSVRTQLGRGLALLRGRLPRGLAVGAVVLACAPRGLAAVRAAVVHAATHVTPTSTMLGVGASAIGIAMKKVLLTMGIIREVVLGIGATAARASFRPSLEAAKRRCGTTDLPFGCAVRRCRVTSAADFFSAVRSSITGRWGLRVQVR